MTALCLTRPVSVIWTHYTVRENRTTALGLSLSGTIAIKQCACNRFLLTLKVQCGKDKKKYDKSVG